MMRKILKNVLHVIGEDLRAALRFLHVHAFPLLLAVVVGGLCVTPLIAARVSIGDAYRGIPFLYVDDDDYYLARMQEIVDGHWAVGSPYLFEYKDQMNAQAPIADVLFYVLPSVVSGVPLTDVLVFTKFAYPALLFLLIYALVKKLAEDIPGSPARALAAAAGFLATLGYQFMDVPSLLHAFQGASSGLVMSVWTRPVNPITGALLLFAGLNLLLSAFRAPRAWKPFALGALWSLMIGYAFSWALMLAVLVISGIRMFALRRREDVRAILIALLTGVLLLAPFWYALVSDTGLGVRNGLTYTHVPTLNKFLIAATVVFLVCSFFLIRRKGERGSWRAIPEWWWFTATLLVAGHSAYMQQIVTGRTIYPFHFVQYTKPFAMLAVILALAAALRARPAWLRMGSAVLIILCAINGLAMALTYEGSVDRFRAWQSDAPMYAWLNAHAPHNCVVLIQEEAEERAHFIPAFTACNIYYKTHLTMYFPPERIRQNVFVWMRVNDVTPDTARAWVESHEGAVRGWFFDSWSTLMDRGMDDWFRRVENDVVSRYADFYEQDFAFQLRDYRVDYLLTDHELSLEEMRLFGAGTLDFSENGLYLYAMPGVTALAPVGSSS